MICSKCGAYNPDYYVFCQNCFADLSDFGVPDGSDIPKTSTAQKPIPEAPVLDDSGDAPFSFENDTNLDDVDDDFYAQDVIIRPIPPVDMDSSTIYEKTNLEKPHESAKKETVSFDESIHGNPKNDENNSKASSIVTPVPTGRNYKENEPYEAPNKNSSSRRMQPPPPISPEISENSEPSTAQRMGAKPSDAEIRRQMREAEREARALDKLQANQGSEYYDYYDYYDEAALRKERRRSHVVVVIFWLILIAAVLLTLVLGASYLSNNYGSVSSGVDAIWNNRSPLKVSAYTESDGTQGHSIEIAGKAGQILTFKDSEFNSSYELVDSKSIAYKLADKNWISLEPGPEQTSLVISPHVVLTDPDGTETTLEVPSYTIDIPQVQLTINSPNPLEGIALDSGILEISGKAYAGGSFVRVYVDEYLLGDNEIDENGEFSCRISVSNDFDVRVIAKSDHMRSQEFHITGTAVPSGEFKINESFASPVESETVSVTGTAPTGGDLQVSGTAGDINYNSVSGEFSFVARLPGPGLHNFTLSVGEQTSELSIKRVPEVNAYTSSASPLNFAEVLAAPGDNAGKVYFFEGVVTELLAQTPIYNVRMSLDSDPSQIVDVTYFGMAQPQIGSKYRVYASANGNTENNTIIRFNAYFIYDEAALSGARANTQAPAGENASTPAPTQ